ncbi:MAG: endonuclease MutS2 [Armatimonadetes bacterium]|nr:endonuclease MutS2 [Armatimonadota bacterium]
MDSHTLDTLEFDAVREQIRRYVACSLGAEEVDRMAPETEVRRIRTRLQEVSEARRIVDARGSFPLDGVRDIRPHLEKASVAGILLPGELLEVLGTIIGARQLQTFILKSQESSPLLTDLAKTITPFPKIESEINRCITPKGEVADHATPQLQTLRQRLKVTHNRMMEKLNSYLRSPEVKNLLQDPVITVRDGRYCMPVKAEHRREFGGLVHDSSASGATLFMEPQAVVDLGNEIRELQLKEEQEIEKILRNLAGLLASQSAALLAMVGTLAQLDLIAAKAYWANEHRAVEPELDTTGRLDLKGARHPLLTGDVVPIDVYLGDEFTALLITGPNTGGKTVTLKTVGLLTLMAQAGIPIPAEEGSKIAIFRQVFADIGDEQSIQQSLSTFSSHVRQIIKILENVDSGTLVLLDEMGAGTDPAEGAALAKAILKYLMKRSARIVATTHYGELKEFAFTEAGCKNASVEFDEETLRPTYRLLVGVPGSSNALAIASRLGMPDEVISAAREMYHPERAALEAIYREMESDRRSAEENESATRAALEDAERLRRQCLTEYDKLMRRKEREIERAVEEARHIVRKAKDEAGEILANLRKQDRESKATETARQRLERVSERVERRRRRSDERLPHLPEIQKGDGEVEGVPEPGEEVLLAQFGQRGVLLRRENGRSEVQVGAMRLTVPTQSLRRVKAQERPVEAQKGVSLGTVSLQRALALPAELDLRGQRADEAMLNLEKYLDDARLAGMKKVRVIHGKGLGALRKVVWDAAKSDPTVGQVTEAPEEEGGAGVAVIELK